MNIVAAQFQQTQINSRHTTSASEDNPTWLTDVYKGLTDLSNNNFYNFPYWLCDSLVRLTSLRDYSYQLQPRSY